DLHSQLRRQRQMCIRDSTRTIIEQMIDCDDRYILFNKKNEGPGPARNYGIAKSQGKYLLFFDSDDHPSTNILKDYDKILKENESIDLIISSFTFDTVRNGKVISKKEFLISDRQFFSHSEFQEAIYDLMSNQFMYVVWNKCYRRDIIIKNTILFKNYRSCEDRIFNLEYFKFCNSVKLNPLIEYSYNFDGTRGITNRYSEKKFDTFKDFYLLANDVTDNQNNSGMSSLLLKGTLSVLFSILKTKEIDRVKKKKEISSILNDDLILQAKKLAETDTSTKKITKISVSYTHLTLPTKL
ncbi:glycosyltransferase family 2 protein, partial [Enterococcus sp. S181_ASV_20]|nr:glycosyltransferase family 2 protein [Enterococcus sp. S181_ASV_20]